MAYISGNLLANSYFFLSIKLLHYNMIRRHKYLLYIALGVSFRKFQYNLAPLQQSKIVLFIRLEHKNLGISLLAIVYRSWKIFHSSGSKRTCPPNMEEIMLKNTLEDMIKGISEQVKNVQNQLDEIKSKVELGEQEFVNMGAMAKMLGIPKSTAYMLSSKNLLPKFKIGKRVIFKKTDVYDFIEKHRISSQKEVEIKAVNSFMKEVQHG